MKIRSSFVTNSSSSSFIIALRSDCEEKDVANVITDTKIELFLKRYVEGVWFNDKEIQDILEESHYTELDNDSKRRVFEYVKSRIISELFSMKDGDLSLDTWNVSSVEASNEGEDLFDMFLYSVLGTVNDEKIKIN
jgi:hypothetical protein